MEKTYHLLTTSEDRQTIDLIDDKYAHGNDLRHLLCDCKRNPNDENWDSCWYIIFILNKQQVLTLRRIGAKSQYLWDRFDPELTKRLNDFLMESLREIYS